MSQTNTDGEIESNQISTSYTNNMDCQWNLSSNAKIELDFRRFKTESSADFVSVYDGSSSLSPLIGTFSGSSLPPPIQSSSGNLFVRFTSNTASTYHGFHAHYRGTMLYANTISTGKVIVRLLVRRGGAVASGSTLVFGSSGPDTSPDRGHCVVLLGGTPISIDVYTVGTAEVSARGNPRMN